MPDLFVGISHRVCSEVEEKEATGEPGIVSPVSVLGDNSLKSWLISLDVSVTSLDTLSRFGLVVETVNLRVHCSGWREMDDVPSSTTLSGAIFVLEVVIERLSYLRRQN